MTDQSAEYVRAVGAVNRILWNERGEDIDEIVIHNPKMVHVEQLDDRCWWIGIYLDDTDRRWSGHFSCDRRGRMTFTEQECDIEWDKDDAHIDCSGAE